MFDTIVCLNEHQITTRLGVKTYFMISLGRSDFIAK